MLRRSDSTNRLNLGEVFRGGTTATGTDRVAFWGDRKRDTETTLLNGVMRRVYVTEEENKRKDRMLTTSFGTGNWLPDN